MADSIREAYLAAKLKADFNRAANPPADRDTARPALNREPRQDQLKAGAKFDQAGSRLSRRAPSHRHRKPGLGLG